jgi:hypothetical protein
VTSEVRHWFHHQSRFELLLVEACCFSAHGQDKSLLAEEYAGKISEPHLAREIKPLL